MASFVVDGLTVPVSVAGHPALDFCNTRAGWGSPTPKEYLHTYAHLAVWARCNTFGEVAGPDPDSAVAGPDPDSAVAGPDPDSAVAGPEWDGRAAVVARALAFREALYGVLVGDGAPAHWALVDAEVRAAAQAAHLTPTVPATWIVADRSRVDFPLLTVAWSAASLLTSPAAAQVAACPGQGCGWLFVDPRGRRRWCSMAWCGNRNKVRRHAQRARDTAEHARDPVTPVSPGGRKRSGRAE